MKLYIGLHIALLALLIGGITYAVAQSTLTPNVGLVKPAFNSPNWGAALNTNYDRLDSVLGDLRAPYKGTWSTDTYYNKSHTVTYSGTYYVSLVDNNQGMNPSSSPSAWAAVMTTSIALSTPSSSSAACTIGAFTADSGFVYVCVATNTWKRSALSTF